MRNFEDDRVDEGVNCMSTGLTVGVKQGKNVQKCKNSNNEPDSEHRVRAEESMFGGWTYRVVPLNKNFQCVAPLL